ncbi:hypothetical protein [Planococcus halotolerans]|uniref:DUF4362 domain-containing protein n=1 Tax=Planococcus halotolerans TaxID=2233542 RepID=A0A365KX41_9BACL|nr:hypothetical protein [Planococcus halotolerans]QHJ69122.1 hypothetical protein DNR44_000025 [Planococcus halotolerans]RAZ77679.1 hypothetical protein DP120_09350 [Planococcus halotolerans]
MLKLKSIAGILLLSVILSGCQNNNVTAFTDATRIEVFDYENTDELIATIEDQKFIKSLTEELDHAETYGTGAVDWGGPDYQLVFKHEDKTLYEIGYNTELLRLGVGGEGRYSKHEKLFEVATELPIE